MSQNPEIIEELYSFLFALRVSLQDDYESETDIIKELKYYLIERGNDPGTIDQTLYGFYQYYGIDISIESIEQIPVMNNQILNNFLGLMLNSNLNSSEVNNQINTDNDIDIFESDNDPDVFDSDNDQPTNIEENQNEQTSSTDNISNIVSSPFFTIQLSSNGQTFTYSQSGQNLNSIENQTVQNPLLQSHSNMINILNSFLSGLNNNNGVMPPGQNIFQDVVVTVDEKEIENLKTVQLEDDLDIDCSICMGHMKKGEKTIELKCTHTFHSDCIEPYLKKYNYKCPVCRTEVGKIKYNL